MTLDIVICRSCKARIFWATTVNNKQIPLDEKPGDLGLVLTERKYGTPLAEARVSAFGENYYMPHHATCPDGKKWRRK